MLNNHAQKTHWGCSNLTRARIWILGVFVFFAGTLTGQQNKTFTYEELRLRLAQIEAKTQRLSGEPSDIPVRKLTPISSARASETVPSIKEPAVASTPLEVTPTTTEKIPSSSKKKDYHHGFRIAPRASTLGAGIEIAKGFTPRFGTRLGFNYFGYDYSEEASDIDYNFDLGLRSIALLADWHPFKGIFRISSGAVLNGNRLKMRADLDPTSPEEINGVSYSLDSVNGTLKFNRFAPYLGIGWDTTFGEEDNWGLTFDLGVIYCGSPKLSFAAEGPDTTSKTFSGDLEQERLDLENDLADFRFWPVVSAGFIYQF